MSHLQFQRNLHKKCLNHSLCLNLKLFLIPSLPPETPRFTFITLYYLIEGITRGYDRRKSKVTAMSFPLEVLYYK